MIALSLCPGIGHITAKKLVEHCGSAKAVLFEHEELLRKVSRFKKQERSRFTLKELLNKAERELEFMHRNEISAHGFVDESYPRRLKHCADGPLVLYTRGKGELNPRRAISIVGSRRATDQGEQFCERLIEELSEFQCTIVSGLAYGIDICAHHAANQHHLPTMAVFGCPLNMVYPAKHRKIAEQMLEAGAWISDYPSAAALIPSNFAERNRIIAGLSDATIVIESGSKGGSMITAGLAMDYNRDVFAVPGRPGDKLSAGCNQLIKSNKAALLESSADLLYQLNWQPLEKSPAELQTSLFSDLSKEEEELVVLLSDRNSQAIDEISLKAAMPVSKTATLLLGLELKGLVRSLPGKMYRLN